MKYNVIKHLTEKQIAFLNTFISGGRWSFDPNTGLVDVNGGVNGMFNNLKYDELPVSFGVVDGHFDVSNLGLTSAKGFPYSIYGDCYIYGNYFKELKWEPEHIKGEISINFNFKEISNNSEIIPYIEIMIQKGIKLFKSSKENYDKIKELYYNDKIKEII